MDHKKARKLQKNIYFCFIDYAKALDCVDYNKLWEILRDGNSRPPYLVKKQQVEQDVEQCTGLKLGKECVKTI